MSPRRTRRRNRQSKRQATGFPRAKSGEEADYQRLAASAQVAFWPIASSRGCAALRRFRSEADVALRLPAALRSTAWSAGADRSRHCEGDGGLDIRPRSGHTPTNSLIEGAFPEGMPQKRSEGRCPRAELPIRTRAALGPRSTGTRTGLHGACLTVGSEASGQNTCEPETTGNPVLGLSHRGRSRWRVPQARAPKGGRASEKMRAAA